MIIIHREKKLLQKKHKMRKYHIPPKYEEEIYSVTKETELGDFEDEHLDDHTSDWQNEREMNENDDSLEKDDDHD